MKKRIISIILTLSLFFTSSISFATNSVSSVAEENRLKRFEVVPGMEAYVDITQKSGTAKAYKEDGTVILVDYEITDTDKGEFILFTNIFMNDNDSKITALSNSPETYYKEKVIRTYRGDNWPVTIDYHEIGPYGPASGTLLAYSVGRYMQDPDIVEVWYHGIMYYGDVSPFGTGEVDF